jgi:hypothetical protein
MIESIMLTNNRLNNLADIDPLVGPAPPRAQLIEPRSETSPSGRGGTCISRRMVWSVHLTGPMGLGTLGLDGRELRM